SQLRPKRFAQVRQHDRPSRRDFQLDAFFIFRDDNALLGRRGRFARACADSRRMEIACRNGYGHLADPLETPSVVATDARSVDVSNVATRAPAIKRAMSLL